VAEQLDNVARYASALGLQIRKRTVLVEGTSDADLFEMAARLEDEATGLNLLGPDLAIVAAGQGDLGGTRGVVRELLILRGIARTLLLPNGKPQYRFVGLFDNDKAGRQGVKELRDLDTSIIEFKDVFRLWPAMPNPRGLDPGDIRRNFEAHNADFKGMDWELEDLLPKSFLDAFFAEHHNAIARTASAGKKIHRELTDDGKARLHRYVKQHAMREDLSMVIETLKCLRAHLGL
jgi:hypothetical protein